MGCGASANKAEPEKKDAPAAAAAAGAEAGAEPKDGKSKEVLGCLEMYFQELQKFTEQELKDLKEAAALRKKKDSAGVVKLNTEIKANRGAFKVKGDGLLKDCFEAADTSEDGYLTKEEAAKLFNTLVAEQGEYLGIMAKAEQRRMLARELGMSKKMFAMYDVEDEEAVKKQMEDDAKEDARKGAEEIDKAMQEALANYKAQKKSRDAAAFKILDKTGDGRVEKKEFLAVFDSTSDIYEAFLTALGLCDEASPTPA